MLTVQSDDMVAVTLGSFCHGIGVLFEMKLGSCVRASLRRSVPTWDLRPRGAPL